MNISKSKIIDVDIPKQSLLPLFYITTWNGMLGLRESEAKLLIKLLEYYIVLSDTYKDQEDVYEKLFSSRIRKEIREKLKVSEHVFNTRLMYLKKKNVILQSSKGIYKIDDRFIPTKELVFRFNVVQEKV